MGNCCRATKPQTTHMRVVPEVVLINLKPKETDAPLLTAQSPDPPLQMSEEFHTSRCDFSDPRRVRGSDPQESEREGEHESMNLSDSDPDNGTNERVSLMSLLSVDHPKPAHPLVPKLNLDALKSNKQTISQEAVEEMRKKWSNSKQSGKGKLKLGRVSVIPAPSSTQNSKVMSDSNVSDDLDLKPLRVSSLTASPGRKPPNLLDMMRNESLGNIKPMNFAFSPKNANHAQSVRLSVVPIMIQKNGSESIVETPSPRRLDSTPIPMSQIMTTTTFPSPQLSLAPVTVPQRYARHGSFVLFQNHTQLSGKQIPIPQVMGERINPVRMTETLNKVKSTGRVQLNDYVIIQEIGSGAFGKVFEAEKFGERFAIKEYNKKKLKHKLMGKQKTAFDSVLEEVAVLSRIQHPNIIYLHEVINSPESRKTYLVMDLASKGSLERLLPMPESKAKGYFKEMILAVEYLHEIVQVVHRDLKPENILLDDKNTVKISDFGSAQVLANPNGTFSNTPGTPAFMSPEQCGGTSEFLGKPLDIWALGVTLFFMVFNRPPFAAKHLGELYESIKSER